MRRSVGKTSDRQWEIEVLLLSRPATYRDRHSVLHVDWPGGGSYAEFRRRGCVTCSVRLYIGRVLCRFRSRAWQHLFSADLTMPPQPPLWTAGFLLQVPLTVATVVFLCILSCQPGASKFHPNGEQNVLKGAPISMTAGQSGHAAADVVLRIYLPFHSNSVQRPGQHYCTDLNDREAVPMAEAVAFAFELLREARDPLLHHNFSLGYDLYDTCASIPPFLTHIEPLIGSTEPALTTRYHTASSSCSACSGAGTPLPEATAVQTMPDACKAGERIDDIEYPTQYDLPSGTGPEEWGSGGIPDIRDIHDFLGINECTKDTVTPFLGPYPKVYVGPITNRLFTSVSRMLREEVAPQLHVSPTPVFEDSEQKDDLSFRTAASYEVQVDALMEICLTQDWRYLSVIVSERHHHEQMKSILESAANLKGICLVSELRLSHNPHQENQSAVLDFFVGLQQVPSLTTVLVLADESDTVNIWNILGEAASNSDLLGNASRGVLDWQWIGFQDWEFVAKKTVQLQPTLDGALPLALRVIPELWAPLPSNHTWANIKQRFKDRLQQLKPTPEVLLRSPWLAPVWEKANRCHLTCSLSFAAAKRNSSCCVEGKYNKEHPHVHFGKRTDYEWENCSDFNASSVEAEFLLDRSLQIMNVVFLIEHVTRHLVDIGLTRCRKGQNDPFYNESCHYLIEFATSKDPGQFLKATAYLEDTILRSEHYQRHIRNTLQNHLDKVFVSNVRNDSGAAPSQSGLEVIGVLNIEQLIRSGNDWEMISAGRVIQHPDNQTVLLDVNISSLSEYNISSCPHRQCQEGYRIRYFDNDIRTCCFLCERCPPGSIRGSTKHDSCQHCPVGSQSNPNQTECVPHQLAYRDISAGDDETVVVLCLSLLGVGAIILTFIIFRINKNNMIVKSADTALSTALLVTLLVSFICVNILILKPTDTTCLMQMAFALIWPVVYVSGLAIKTNRLRVVFQQSSKLSRRNMRYLSNNAQLLVLVLVGVITSSYFIAWGVWSPPTAEIISSSTTRKLVCKFSSGWMGGYFGFTFTLITLTSTLAYFTRHLPGFFNEAVYHFLASALILTCWIILVPAYYFSQQVTPSIILAAIVLAQGYSIFGSLFIRRLYYICMPPEESSSQFLTSSMGSSYSQRVTDSNRRALDTGSNGNGRAHVPVAAESCAHVSLGPDSATGGTGDLKANGGGRSSSGEHTGEVCHVAVVLQACPKSSTHLPISMQEPQASGSPRTQSPTDKTSSTGRAGQEPGSSAPTPGSAEQETTDSTATAQQCSAGTPDSASAAGKQLSAAACSSEVSAAFVFLASSASSDVPSSSSPGTADHLIGMAGGADGDGDATPFALS